MRFFPQRNSAYRYPFGLITVAEVIHWFDFEEFYRQAMSVSRRNAIIAIWYYDMHKINSEIDKLNE